MGGGGRGNGWNRAKVEEQSGRAKRYEQCESELPSTHTCIITWSYMRNLERFPDETPLEILANFGPAHPRYQKNNV